MALQKKTASFAITRLPEVIANAFCNGCVRLPNFDLLIISLSVRQIFVVSYWFTTDPYAVAFKRVNVINSALVAMETAAVRHYPTVRKHRNKGYFDQNNTVLIPNVTQFVQKTYFTANKVRKIQLIDDWQNYV